MKRFKPPKQNKIYLHQKQKDEIIMTVKKKLYPMWVALFITATKDTVGLTKEQTELILTTANRYALRHSEGVVNIEDFKRTIENDLGERLEDLLRI